MREEEAQHMMYEERDFNRLKYNTTQYTPEDSIESERTRDELSSEYPQLINLNKNNPFINKRLAIIKKTYKL